MGVPPPEVLVDSVSIKITQGAGSYPSRAQRLVLSSAIHRGEQRKGPQQRRRRKEGSEVTGARERQGV